MKTIFSSVCIIACLCAVGCGEKKQYEWCDYSNTYYDVTKKDCTETQIKHKSELERIVETSAKKNLPVPPGIYAEYGFLVFKSGKPKDALGWYAKERELYPESAVFVEMLSRAAQRQIDQEEKPQAEQPLNLPETNQSGQAAPVETQTPAKQG